ncbi:MAG: hypothetical protein J6P67_00945, partial [Bacteroidaceae bacterium]|nr:hypothetical protein [Bacteroidaceae bacterium]
GDSGCSACQESALPIFLDVISFLFTFFLCLCGFYVILLAKFILKIVCGKIKKYYGYESAID